MHRVYKTILFILLAFILFRANNKDDCRNLSCSASSNDNHLTHYYEISDYHRIWNDESSSDESCGKSVASCDNKDIDTNPSDEFTWKISLLARFRFSEMDSDKSGIINNSNSKDNTVLDVTRFAGDDDNKLNYCLRQKKEIISKIISALNTIKKLDYQPTGCHDLNRLKDALEKHPKGRRIGNIFLNKNFDANYNSNFPVHIKNLIYEYRNAIQNTIPYDQKSEILSNIISALQKLGPPDPNECRGIWKLRLGLKQYLNIKEKEEQRIIEVITDPSFNIDNPDFPADIRNLIEQYKASRKDSKKSEILSNIISAVSVIKKLDYRPTICPNLSKLRDALGKYPKGRRVSEVFTNKNFCFNYTSDFPADIRNLIEQYKASTQDSQKSEILSNIISALEKLGPPDPNECRGIWKLRLGLKQYLNTKEKKEQRIIEVIIDPSFNIDNPDFPADIRNLIEQYKILDSNRGSDSGAYF